jgi:RND family efflux transporter MFP subunit
MRTSPGTWLVSAGLVGLTLLGGCRDATLAQAPSARPVQVQRVTFANADVSREFVGVVRARYETDLGFRVAGKIVARLVNVGDSVTSGQVVAKLDSQDLKLQAESAAAELAAATSNLSQAAAEAERYATLKVRGYAAAADFDRKQAAKDEAEGRLERARHALDLARNQLTYADLRCDADGVITATLAEAGQVVPIGQGVVRLARRGEKEAVIALPETWLDAARHAGATVELWSDPGHRFAARLRELSPQADAATRTYAARFTIEQADDTVVLGMTATVSLTPASAVRVARLRLSAVVNRGGGPFVYALEAAGALVQRPVTVLAFTEDAALVTAGVNEGEQIVTLGVQKLQAGLKVRAVDVR